MKEFSWELIQLFLSFFEPDPKIQIFFEKEGAAEESNVDFEITVNAPAAKQCCRLRKISYRSYLLFLFSFLKRIAFLSIIWLPHNKIWTISQGQPLLPYINHCVLGFLTLRCQELCHEVGCNCNVVSH